MARIYSAYDIAGRYGNLVVYWVGDQLYSCTKSSLDEKRFRKDRAFKKAREKAKAFGIVSQLAKEVYKSLPKEAKRHGVFGQLTGFIHQGLQGGKSKEAIVKEVNTYLGIVPVETIALVNRPRKKHRLQLMQRSLKTKLLSDWYISGTGSLEKSSPVRKPFYLTLKDVAFGYSSLTYRITQCF